MRLIAFAIVSLAIAAVQRPVHAQACWIDYTNLTEAIKWPCEQNWINHYWNGYSFEQADWDGALGFNAVCDGRTPLARTFNAIEHLHFSAVDEPLMTNVADFQGNILRWGGNYAMREIDELDFACGEYHVNLLNQTNRAYTWWGGVDDLTELYLSFFYNMHRVERAAILIHEARHADWCAHNGNSGQRRCPARSASCDEQFEGDSCNGFGSPSGLGAQGWGTKWLWYYLGEADGQHATTTPRAYATDRANYNLNNMFDKCPGYSLNQWGNQITDPVCP